MLLTYVNVPMFLCLSFACKDIEKFTRAVEELSSLSKSVA